MTTIQEILSQLDELRENATQGNWKDSSEPYSEVWGMGSEGDIQYIIALHNAYVQLRQAALEGERYKEVGEALAKAVEGMEQMDTGMLGGEFARGRDVTNIIWRKKRDAALLTYRQSIAGEEGK